MQRPPWVEDAPLLPWPPPTAGWELVSYDGLTWMKGRIWRVLKCVQGVGENIVALTCKFQTMLLGEKNGPGNILRSSGIDDNTLKSKVSLIKEKIGLYKMVIWVYIVW
jgi:hypothetical protein